MAHILDVILEKNHISEKSFLDSVPSRKKNAYQNDFLLYFSQ